MKHGGAWQLQQLAGPDPEMLLPGGGGALKTEVLNRAGKAARGYERGDKPPLIRGVPEHPPEIFSKSMYLRTHFKPF